MVTDSAQHESTHPGFFARIGDWVRRTGCGLRGHDALLHFERGRLSLMCTSCGYESPGWELKGVPARQEVSTRAPKLVRLPFARAQRAA